MITRHLATIQKIVDIQPIEGADSIEVATVLGWHVVVKKDEFKIGDLCVYFEVDSLLPPREEFEFLSKNGLKKSYVDGREFIGYRLKTIRLRGQISQGLCQPLSILDGLKYFNDQREKPIYSFDEGLDVTVLLGVVKYEPAIPGNLSGEVKGLFPSYIPKTDEPRIQGAPSILERWSNELFYVTEKIDGTSITVFLDEDGLNVCGRTLNLKENEGNAYWRAARALNLEEKLKNLGKKVALQGELFGSNIQSNRLKQSTQNIRFYSIFDVESDKYMSFDEFSMTLEELGLEMVPIITVNYTLPKTVDELITFATRKSKIAPECWAEGIVLRPQIEKQDPDLGRLSFKAINPEFLLKHGE